jgi:hypothetical protein
MTIKYRRLEILPVPCQYILSLMLFITDNPNNFQTVSEVHGLHTGCKINCSFQIQTSQVFKKEVFTLVLKYTIVCPAIFKALRMIGNNLKMNYTGNLRSLVLLCQRTPGV